MSQVRIYVPTGCQSLLLSGQLEETDRLRCDNMSLLFFVKSGNPLDRKVVRLGSTRCKDDIFGICSNNVGHVLEQRLSA
jgi:hypothetical protein